VDTVTTVSASLDNQNITVRLAKDQKVQDWYLVLKLSKELYKEEQVLYIAGLRRTSLSLGNQFSFY
jgi:hypothetical protein